jgi:hypothetical protein
MNHSRIPLLLVVLAGIAHADTLYKCTDSAGHTTYTNQKTTGKHCVVLSQDKPVSTFAAPKTQSRSSASEGFPRVSSETQKNRDSARQQILQGELATERRNLEEAKKALAEQEAVREGGERNYQRVLDRLQPYQEKVRLHERNIDAIQKEIDNQR